MLQVNQSDLLVYNAYEDCNSRCIFSCKVRQYVLLYQAGIGFFGYSYSMYNSGALNLSTRSEHISGARGLKGIILKTGWVDRGGKRERRVTINYYFI